MRSRHRASESLRNTGVAQDRRARYRAWGAKGPCEIAEDNDENGRNDLEVRERVVKMWFRRC
jgi:hypothetical protein